jgi:DNA-binding NarL/FixJ family response regulator
MNPRDNSLEVSEKAHIYVSLPDMAKSLRDGERNVKILLIDDHALFRAGMKYVLQELASDVTVTEASNCQHAIVELEKNNDFNLILLDLDMPGISGFACISQIILHAKGCPVVILSADDRHDTIQQTARYGIQGYILKSTDAEEMLPLLKKVLNGQSIIPTNLNSSGVRENLEPTKLTARQKEILSLIVQGKSNKQIAAILGITEGTTRIHVTTIFKSLNVRSRSEAVYKALNLDIDYQKQCSDYLK